MKAKQITVGGVYIARVSGRFVPVKVTDIYPMTQCTWDRWGIRREKLVTRYDVTNLATKRTTTFRSAQRFRRPATTPSNPALRAAQV